MRETGVGLFEREELVICTFGTDRLQLLYSYVYSVVVALDWPKSFSKITCTSTELTETNYTVVVQVTITESFTQKARRETTGNKLQQV